MWVEETKVGEMMNLNCFKDMKKEMGLLELEDLFGEEPGDFSYEDLEKRKKDKKTKSILKLLCVSNLSVR